MLSGRGCSCLQTRARCAAQCPTLRASHGAAPVRAIGGGLLIIFPDAVWYEPGQLGVMLSQQHQHSWPMRTLGFLADQSAVSSADYPTSDG